MKQYHTLDIRSIQIARPAGVHIAAIQRDQSKTGVADA